MTRFGRAFLKIKSFISAIVKTTMSIDTFKRFDRIIAIFIHLQSKRVVKAQEMAERFEVSLRTIYRDIRTLESCGVPISGEAGVGYTIIEGYRLPPIMFTREEAGSFIAAEKLMQKFTDKSLGDYHESAMFKVKSVLRTKEKDWISAIESQVSVTPGQSLFNNNIPNALEILFESIAEKKQVDLIYQSLQSDTDIQRNIEPVGLFHENNFWYVLGYCHLRKNYRHFRTDRMHSIKRSTKDFTKQHLSMEKIRMQENEVERIKVRILIAKNVAKHLSHDKYHYGFVSEKSVNDQIEMTFLSPDIAHSFPRWFLMFGEFAQILEPEQLKNHVKELLERTEKMLNI